MTSRSERSALTLAWLLPFALFLITAYRDVGYWDTGEMDTVPYLLGIAHPTGFPAYTLLGWAVTHALPIGAVAFRMSLVSAVALSLAAFLVARIVYERDGNAWAGTVAACIFATGGAVWAHATKAEVHAVATLADAATIYCALRWKRDADARWFLRGAAAWGFGIAVHPVCALLLPGLLVLLIARFHELESKTVATAIALCAVIVVGFYAYLPLRSAYVVAHGLDPQVAMGLPAGRPFFNYDDPSTLAGFRAQVTGSDFAVDEGMRAIVDPSIYLRRGPEYLASLRDEFTWFGLPLILAGIIVSFRRDRLETVVLATLGAVAVPFALGFPDETDLGRYFMTSFAVSSIFAGTAIAAIAARLPRRFGGAVPAVAALIAVALAATQRNFYHQPWDDRARREIVVVNAVTEPNAMIVANWAYATPLAYAKYVEGGLGARGLDAAWIDDDADYVVRWAKTRPVYFVGAFPGSVPGYVTEALAVRPPIYRLVKR